MMSKLNLLVVASLIFLARPACAAQTGASAPAAASVNGGKQACALYFRAGIQPCFMVILFHAPSTTH